MWNNDWRPDQSWTLFLDRDGVINERIFGGYVTSPEDFRFIPGVTDSLRLLANVFGKILIVTNQQGVAKKLMSESNLSAVHRYLEDQVQKSGGRIDFIFAATNLKGVEPDRRKPESAMALEAKLMFPEIDFEKSIIVGDTDSDLRFGKKLGMRTVLIRSAENVCEKADLEVESLVEFAKIIGL